MWRIIHNESMPMRLIRLLIVLPLALLAAASPAAEELQRFPSAVLSIRTHQTTEWFSVWVADTTARQEQGLMFQKWLPPDWGMLFPEDTPRVKSMWMKNTLIPLDMLFIDAKGRIVGIRARTTPESLDIITLPVPVKAVLELNGGACQRSDIRVGDQVRFALFGTSPGAPAVGN